MEKFYTYILLSDSTGKFYTGQTNDLEDRFKRHNSGENKSTKAGLPWKLVYSNTFDNRSEAVQLETRIKKRGAKRFLDDLKNKSIG